MDAILDPLGLNSTFFAELALFAIFYVWVSRVYFRPFLGLFRARHQKLVSDQRRASELSRLAQEKDEVYRQSLGEERKRLHALAAEMLTRVRHEEAQILAQARDQAKHLTQAATGHLHEMSRRVRSELETQVESLSDAMVEQLLREPPR